MRIATIVILLAAFFTGLPAAAKPIGAGITRDEVTAFLQSKGYPVKAAKDDNGLLILKSTAIGVNFDVYFFDCDSAGRCQSIQFAAGWTMSTPAKFDKLNEWNREHRFMRAYTQQGGALYGEMDMILQNGSTEQLEENRKLWEVLLAKFKTHFGI